eukprot:767616-Hanusia_phi.AAC.1
MHSCLTHRFHHHNSFRPLLPSFNQPRISAVLTIGRIKRGGPCCSYSDTSLSESGRAAGPARLGLVPGPGAPAENETL